MFESVCVNSADVDPGTRLLWGYVVIIWESGGRSFQGNSETSVYVGVEPTTTEK